jgi:hypothetical protein
LIAVAGARMSDTMRHYVPGRPRIRAALIHAALSLCVAALAAGLVFGLWYPWPYRTVSGGTELFSLLMSVDVIVGPLLTLVVFDVRKPRPELRRDIGIVVLLQMVALAYGLHTVALARPAVLALEGQRFRAVIAADVVEAELAQAPSGLQAIPLTGPVTVATEVPTEGDRQYDAIAMALAGVDIGMRPSFWRHWDAAAGQAALARSKPLAELARRFAQRQAEVEQAVRRTGRPIDRLRYLPLLARRNDWVVLLDAGDGEIAGFAPLDGF